VLVSSVEAGDCLEGDRHKLKDEQRGMVGDDCFVTSAVFSVDSAELEFRD